MLTNADREGIPAYILKGHIYGSYREEKTKISSFEMTACPEIIFLGEKEINDKNAYIFISPEKIMDTNITWKGYEVFPVLLKVGESVVDRWQRMYGLCVCKENYLTVICKIDAVEGDPLFKEEDEVVVKAIKSLTNPRDLGLTNDGCFPLEELEWVEEG